jgi:hypothetical protein
VSRRASLLKERRRASRLHTSLACGVQWEGARYSGHLLSLSLEGALVAVACSPPAGAVISITLELPWLNKTASVEGEVVRTTTASNIMHQGMRECGVHWKEITPESRLLMDMVTTRDKLGVRPFRLVK